MSLEVVKVEEGLCDGKVLFHAFEERSEAAVAAGDEKQEAARKAAAEKEARRKQQVLWRRLCDPLHRPTILFRGCNQPYATSYSMAKARHVVLAGFGGDRACWFPGGECQAEGRYCGRRQGPSGAGGVQAVVAAGAQLLQG